MTSTITTTIIIITTTTITTTTIITTTITTIAIYLNSWCHDSQPKTLTTEPLFHTLTQ